MSENGHIGIARSADSGLNRVPTPSKLGQRICSFEALLRVVEKDYYSGEYAVPPSHDEEVGLSMDGSRESNTAAEELNTVTYPHPLPVYPVPTRQPLHPHPFPFLSNQSIPMHGSTFAMQPQPSPVPPMQRNQDCIFPFRGM